MSRLKVAGLLMAVSLAGAKAAGDDRTRVADELVPLPVRLSAVACPGERVFLTDCFAPLTRTKGPWKVECDLPGATIYCPRWSFEQIGTTGNTYRKTYKWLEPGGVLTVGRGEDVQYAVDFTVPKDAPAGTRTYTVALTPAKGKAIERMLRVRVIPLQLGEPFPWGFFLYEWSGVTLPETHPDYIRRLKDQRAWGLSQAAISPIHYQNRPVVHPDGTADWACFEEAFKCYRAAGFTRPPTLNMEGLGLGTAEVLGLRDKLVASINGFGVTDEQLPPELKSLTEKVVRNLYDHSLEAKWPPFYAYMADEPFPGYASGTLAHFTLGLTRKVAPELQTAETLYTFRQVEFLSGLVDMVIVHWVHPCNNADANRRWRHVVSANEMALQGIEFMGPVDTLWEGRITTLCPLKGGLEGMLNWVQWFESPMPEAGWTPEVPFESRWKGGPMVYVAPDGKRWPSLAWVGVREGLTDSRYVNALKAAIDRAKCENRWREVRTAKVRLAALMDEVPWATEARQGERNAWAYKWRERLAEAAMDCNRGDHSGD